MYQIVLFLFKIDYNLHISIIFILVLFIIVTTKLIICNKMSLLHGFVQIQVCIVPICFSCKIVKYLCYDYDNDFNILNIFNLIFR